MDQISQPVPTFPEEHQFAAVRPSKSCFRGIYDAVFRASSGLNMKLGTVTNVCDKLPTALR